MSPRNSDRDHAVAVAFGQRVRAARTAAGLTQEALAEAAEVHPTFISNVERGYRLASIVTLIRLATALDVPASHLIDGLSISD